VIVEDSAPPSAIVGGRLAHRATELVRTTGGEAFSRTAIELCPGLAVERSPRRELGV
jgi:hypothetical protein